MCVFLNRDAKASKTQLSKELGKHFTAEKESQIAALAAARGDRRSKRPPAFRFFPRLGVVLGDGDGFKALRQRADRALGPLRTPNELASSVVGLRTLTLLVPPN